MAKAKPASKNSGSAVTDHFVDVSITMQMLKGTIKKVPNYSKLFALFALRFAIFASKNWLSETNP